MKKQLILGSLLAFAGVANAQWDNLTGQVSTTGNIGINVAAPLNDLDVHTTAIDGGISITQDNRGSGSANLLLDNSYGRKWALLSTGPANNIGADHFAIYDVTGANPWDPKFFIQGATGLVGIATYNPNAQLHVASSSPASILAAQFDGDVYINGYSFSATGYVSSDRKLKKDIKPLTTGLDKIKLLKPSTYTFRTDEFTAMKLPKGQQIGMIAQELEGVFPELVTEVAGQSSTDKDGKKTTAIPAHKVVNYTGLIPVLIAGIQELQGAIESQQKVNEMQAQAISDLQKQLANSSSQKAANATGINTDNGNTIGFQMSQNEPNPFTHETVVKYVLPQATGNAFMAVYNLSGKQITTFPIQEKGSSSITITSEKLSAGIYIYSIVADGKVVDSKRMIVADK